MKFYRIDTFISMSLKLFSFPILTLSQLKFIPRVRIRMYLSFYSSLSSDILWNNTFAKSECRPCLSEDLSKKSDAESPKEVGFPCPTFQDFHFRGILENSTFAIASRAQADMRSWRHILLQTFCELPIDSRKQSFHVNRICDKFPQILSLDLCMQCARFLLVKSWRFYSRLI